MGTYRNRSLHGESMDRAEPDPGRAGIDLDLPRQADHAFG